ncbi:uncharacterized protein BXIN_3082 [Babesia sp. Xinjiang]|uniref:uncharacterized protein n=1 Tax=Babesia sp. Xinjiang TaxID=462227 RepID=UPI000A234270|nr:uncharacterized protein BXIN_3082 [Babesia sp. Xinjiang]ORM39557.1 hypothetical protein BXIN_3082 [Babesia sp. Xinjiang]
METCLSDDACYESDASTTRDNKYTSGISNPSTTKYRTIKVFSCLKLIHLIKRLLIENTTWSHNEALNIAITLLRSIPPSGYLAEDLFLVFVWFLQRDYKLKGVGDAAAVSSHEKQFLKFLSITGSTSAFLRPLVMMHGVRILAANGRIYDMKCLIQRNCKEWNMEKHPLAQYYKWIVKHVDILCNSDLRCSSDYKIELEHILKTCADLRMLPNGSLFRLFIEANKGNPDKILQMLNVFIAIFPQVHFLRKYRAEHCVTANHAEDVILRCVYSSGFDRLSIAFAMERKKLFELKEFILMLFQTTIAQPNNKTNWERLLYHLLTEAELEDVVKVLEDLFKNELRRAKSLFTKEGTWALFIREKLVRYYLATARIVLFKELETYRQLYRAVKGLTGVSLKRKHMEADNPVWQHFKKIPQWKLPSTWDQPVNM